MTVFARTSVLRVLVLAAFVGSGSVAHADVVPPDTTGGDPTDSTDGGTLDDTISQSGASTTGETDEDTTGGTDTDSDESGCSAHGTGPSNALPVAGAVLGLGLVLALRRRK
jgi:MYXO-CTERM domain-containing protein